MIIFLVKGCVFLLLCLSYNLCLEARNYEFYLVEYWVFLDSYKCFLSLFWNGVKLLRNIIILLSFTFMIYEASLGYAQSRAHYSRLLKQDPLNFLPSAS